MIESTFFIHDAMSNGSSVSFPIFPCCRGSYTCLCQPLWFSIWRYLEISRASVFCMLCGGNRATLMGIAKHYKTGEQLSEELYSKLLAARTFRAASNMLRQVYTHYCLRTQP
jgi:hypothetical protein